MGQVLQETQPSEGHVEHVALGAICGCYFDVGSLFKVAIDPRAQQ